MSNLEDVRKSGNLAEKLWEKAKMEMSHKKIVFYFVEDDTYEVINKVFTMYKEHGMNALSYKWLKSKGYLVLYNQLVGKHKIRLEDISIMLDIHIKWREQRRILMSKSKGHKQWDIAEINKTLDDVISQYTYLPPAEFLRSNGYGNLVTAIYNNDMTFEKIKLDRGLTNQMFVSRNNMTWLSSPEVCLANFLLSRGITIQKGKKYPKEYSEMTGRKYGVYDLHFIATKDKFVGKTIDVEVWGDCPNGHGTDIYESKRKVKEEFNRDNTHFIGIQYSVCYKTDKLIEILSSYIENIDIQSVSFKPMDKKVEPTRWNLFDSVIEQCKQVIKFIPNGKLPTEEWMRRRGKFKDREVYEWETDINLNSLSKYIQEVGGIRLIRESIGDESSTIKWNRDVVLNVALEIYSIYKKSPQSVLGEFQKRKNLSRDEIQMKNKISGLLNACSIHFIGGYREVCETVNIPIRKIPKTS